MFVLPLRGLDLQALSPSNTAVVGLFLPSACAALSSCSPSHTDFPLFLEAPLPNATKERPSLADPDPHECPAPIMTVEDVMSRDVVTVAPDAALTEIRNSLHGGGFHHLLVVEDGELLGVISDRDVLRAISPLLDTYREEPRDGQPLSQPARDIMRIDPITVRPGTGIEEAAHLLLDHDISSLPVVEDAELGGIVTTKDFLSHYANGANGE